MLREILTRVASMTFSKLFLKFCISTNRNSKEARTVHIDGSQYFFGVPSIESLV